MTAMAYRDRVYGQMADAFERGPHLNELATGRAANLTVGWGKYNGQVIPVYDSSGHRHMITDKQNRIYLWAMGKAAMLDTTVKLRDVAAQLDCSVDTVRRMLLKLMAWGKLAFWSLRGRYGKTVLWPRRRADDLERFADYARAKIKAAWQRRVNVISNVRTSPDRRGIDTSTDQKTETKTATYPFTSSSSYIRTGRYAIERDDRIEAHLMAMQTGFLKRVPCPAHGGQDRNLSFWRREDGSLGVKCWSHNCKTREIKDAIEPWR